MRTNVANSIPAALAEVRRERWKIALADGFAGSVFPQPDSRLR